MNKSTIQNALSTQQNAAVDKKAPKTPGARMDHILRSEALQTQFQNTLREKAPAFTASIIDLYSSDTYLQKCDPAAVALECLKAATLDLPINKQLGFAWVVPYTKNGKQIPQFQLGYKGYIQLAQRTGAYKFINADVVYDGELAGRDKLTGCIDLNGEKLSDKVAGYFAYIETLNGYSKTLYMSYDEVVAWAKRYSKSYSNQSSAWASNFDEMAIKTCLRRLISKWGIMSVQMVQAFESEDVNDLADQQILSGDDDPAAGVTPASDFIDADYKTVDEATGEVS